jgi:hypothetical protein
MIFADSKFLGVLPSPLHDAKAIDGLADTTGAHIIVSDKPIPPIGELIKKHAAGNSVFIAITEFPNRSTEDALKKMIENGVRIKHFVILGNIIDYGGDQAWHNNSYKGAYSHYIKWLAHIASVGAISVAISGDYLDAYVKEIENSIGNDIDFLSLQIREYKPITDGSVTLATVPSIGAVRARAIVDKYKEDGRHFNLIDVISLYTNREKCSGNIYNKSICEGARAWFGVPDGWNITLEPEERMED